MELSEVSDLVRMNMTLYKNSAKPLTEKEAETTVSIWYWHFKDYDARLVKRAFLAANAVCVYPIQPADIFEQLKIMAKNNSAAPSDLWQALKSAVAKVPGLLYQRQYPKVICVDEKTGKLIKSNGEKELNELFDKLPAQVKSYLRNVNGLVSMAQYSDEELERYKKRDFLTEIELIEDGQTNSQLIESLKIQKRDTKLLNGE